MGKKRNERAVSETQFGALIRALARDIIDAHVYWKQYNTLQEEIEQRPLVYAEASMFWLFARNAHLQTALAALARAFDKEGSALHLYSWLTTISNHLHFFKKKGSPKDDSFAQSLRDEQPAPDPEQLKRDIASCAPEDPDVNALIQYRNTQLAHRGHTLALQGEVAELPQLPHEQIERLLLRAKTILNRYNYMFDSSMYVMGSAGDGSPRAIFEAVQRDIDRREQQRIAQIAAGEAYLDNFRRKMEKINRKFAGREDQARSERSALAERYGFTIDAEGNPTGVIIWRNPQSQNKKS